MEIKTFRAKTMQQALNLVRQELGAEATVLHTRELNAGLLSRVLLGRQYEIAASTQVRVPTRIAQTPAIVSDYSARYREDFQHLRDDGLQELHALASQLEQRTQGHQQQLPDALFETYTDLIEADVDENVAQELVEDLRHKSGLAPHDSNAYRTELTHMLEDELRVAGPIAASAGQGRIVALVGPTGVGKTTTIAKLAANYRLRENKRVGLITVDTYRIAAVEQLRTYAEIIDLPMEVVSTPREMREARARMSDLDLVLMDTAGRSPRDEVKIQELKSMLAEAAPAEVHLVLSAVGGAKSLATTAERFAAVGTTALIVTKLDETTTLGNLVSLTRSSRLPISYLTNGQNVPDDIQIAQSRNLAQLILGERL
jgi:flagellar biosynthesis protein FlhF